MIFDRQMFEPIVARLGLTFAAAALLAVTAPGATAQTGQVTGRVLAADGQVIPFAAVQWEGADGWTAVRANGDNTLVVPAGT